MNISGFTNKIEVLESLELEKTKPEFAQELFCLIQRNVEHLSTWLPWVPLVKSVVDTTRFIENRMQSETSRLGTEYSIKYKKALIGQVGLNDIDSYNRKLSLGFWLSKSHEGRGLMAACIRRLVKEVYSNTSVNRIEITCNPKNTRSISLAVGLGFRLEGRLREVEFLNGTLQDHLVFAMLKRDWLA